MKFLLLIINLPTIASLILAIILPFNNTTSNSKQYINCVKSVSYASDMYCDSCFHNVYGNKTHITKCFLK